MRRALAFRTAAFAGLISALGASACTDSRYAAGRVNPTYLKVDPGVFLGDGDCATSAAGGLRWYVATLIDVTADEDGKPASFRLPSSPPTACSKSVFFSGVVPSGSSLGEWHEAHEYVVELEGYDAETLRPLHEGSSVMTTAGAAVPPGWVGSCGSKSSELSELLGVDAGSSPAADAGFRTQFEGPLSPYPGRTVTFPSCELQRIGEETETGRVTVSLSQALAGLACGHADGEVASFEVTLGNDVQSAACGDEVTFKDLEPGTFLEFEVVAVGTTAADAGTDAGGGVARWTTTCYQESVADQQLAARCDPLVRDQ